MRVICLYIVGTWCVIEEREFFNECGKPEASPAQPEKVSFPSPSVLLDSLGPENSGLILNEEGEGPEGTDSTVCIQGCNRSWWSGQG